MENKKTNELKGADSKLLAQEAVKLLIEKKAKDVRLYSVAEKTSVTDYYINATGRSSTHVGSLAGELADALSERGAEHLHIEGRMGNAWVLIDYGDVIINVFDKPSREFYDFDRLQPAGSEVDISPLIAEVDEKMKINTAKE